MLCLSIFTDYLPTRQYQCITVLNTRLKQLKDAIDKIHNYNASKSPQGVEKIRKIRNKHKQWMKVFARSCDFSWSSINVQRLQCCRKQIRFNDKKKIEIVQSLILSPLFVWSQISGQWYLVLDFVDFYFFPPQKLKFLWRLNVMQSDSY